MLVEAFGLFLVGGGSVVTVPPWFLLPPHVPWWLTCVPIEGCKRNLAGGEVCLNGRMGHERVDVLKLSRARMKLELRGNVARQR